MFRHRCQKSSYPMRITAVKKLGPHRLFQIDRYPALWPESSLIPYKEWVALQKRQDEHDS